MITSTKTFKNLIKDELNFLTHLNPTKPIFCYAYSLNKEENKVKITFALDTNIIRLEEIEKFKKLKGSRNKKEIFDFINKYH